jgi:hypothetical protein
MRRHHSAATFAAVTLALASGLAGQGPGGVRALAPIVGEWQSDTTNGNSARSSCAWTPQGGAVLCEQTISTPNGVRRAQDLFVRDSAGSRYFLYVAQTPGDTLAPVPLAITGTTWTYGGTAAAPNGKWWRTINEFVAPDRYDWRLESSADGKSWTRVMGGTSRRVARP